jgi:hypothetical protein
VGEFGLQIIGAERLEFRYCLLYHWVQMTETKNSSDSYGHAQNNLLTSVNLSTHLYVSGGKVTERGVSWLKEALVKSGPDLLEKLGPEMQTAAREILAQKQKKG